MIPAFLFLLSRSFVNRTKARVRRLKQPKYLIGAIFGLVYLWGYLFQFLFGRRGSGSSMLAGAGSIIENLGAVILLLLVLAAWIFPHQRAALIFSEAEIAFLFPAPVSRRALIHYKLLKSQLAILFTVLLLTLITGRFFVNRHAWMHVIGWMVILSTLNLHFLGASFARTMLLERGISNWFRRGAVLVLITVMVTLTVWWAQQTITLPIVEDMTEWKAWRDYFQNLLGMPPLSYLLFPFRFVLAPYLADSTSAFAKALLPALGIIVVHYIWVVRSNVAFEEASVEASRRFAEKIALARQGRPIEAKPTTGRRAPFALAPTGFQPVAFLWKNLINMQAAFRGRTLIFIALPLVIAAVIMGRAGERGGVFLGTASMLTAMLFTWSLFIGAQFVRCDFRQDLVMMDVLKLFPLRGWQVVAGEVFAPMVILGAVQWLLVLVLALLLSLGDPAAGLPGFPLEWLAVAAVIAPFWNGLALLIPNAAVLWFPGWFQTRIDAPQGIEVTGQRLLLLFGQMIVVAITIVPALFAFALGFVPMRYAGFMRLAPLVGAGGAVIVIAGEIALGIWQIGRAHV